MITKRLFMKRVFLIIALLFFSANFLMTEENVVMETSLIDGVMIKAITVAYERFCAKTSSKDCITNFDFAVRITSEEIHVDVMRKGPVLGGIGSYVIDKKSYCILNEVYHP